jgi:site-specific DNA-methyltransferase (adenine-specific)
MALMARYPNKYFDLAVVDPPYGIGEDGQRNITGDRPTAKWRNPKSQHYVTFDDSKIPDTEYWQQLFRVSRNQIIWGGNYFTKHLPVSKGWIVWDKVVDIKEHLSMCELAWSSFDKKCNKFEYLWAGFKKKHQVTRIHPTQKPVALYDWIFKNYAKEGDKILDTHLGSGSSRISAWKAGLDFTACELDADYFAAQEKRFKEFTAQMRLF